MIQVLADLCPFPILASDKAKAWVLGVHEFQRVLVLLALLMLLILINRRGCYQHRKRRPSWLTSNGLGYVMLCYVRLV